MSGHKQYRRWYDSDQDVASAVTLLENFPDYFLDEILAGVSEIAERDCNAHDKLMSLKNLGADRVMSIYKSKRKQRSQDQSAQMHKVMNYLYIMSDDERRYVSKAVQGIVSSVYDYIKFCDQYHVEIDLQDIQAISRQYVTGGVARCQHMLEQIKTSKLAAGQANAPLEVTAVERIEHGQRVVQESERGETTGG